MTDNIYIYIKYININRIKEMFNLCSVGSNTTPKLIKQAPHRTQQIYRHPVIYGTSL